MGAAGLYTCKDFLPACFLVPFPEACLPPVAREVHPGGCEAGTPRLGGWARGQAGQQLGLGKAVPPGPGFQGAAVSCEFKGRREG